MGNDEKSQSFGASVCMKFVERCGTQLVTIVLNIILARLLSPDDYGVLAILNVFIVLAQVLTQYGINNAIIQKQNPNDEDYSTGLILSILISMVLYIVLFIASPFIAAFYESAELALYLRVLALSMIPVSLNAVFTSILMKKMQFRKIMIIGIVSNVSACATGVVLAYMGFGVWSLIIQQMMSNFIQSVLLLIWIRWEYSFRFSKESAAFILKYGGTISMSAIIDNWYYDFESLLIGKWFSQALLGVYTNARTYPLRVISSVKDTISGVVFPAMSKIVEDKAEMKKLAKLSINLFSFVVFPAMIGFALIAKEFVTVFLTEKWLSVVFPMQAFCLSFAFLSISSPNIQVIKALGKAKLNLCIEILRKAIILLSLIIAILLYNSVEAVAIGFTISNVITALVVAAICGHQIHYELTEQLMDMIKSIMPVVAMVVSVAGIDLLLSSENFGLISMLVKIVVGGIVYLGCAFLSHHPVIQMVCGKLKNKLKSGRIA